VIGASAGGVEALKSLVTRLPADLPAAICVVIHLPPQGPNLLASILSGLGPLPVDDAVHGAIIQAAHIYVAVPDRHLLIDGNSLRLSRGPKENRFRPAVDALFRSAAYSHGNRVFGVVLTGQLDDGTAGLWAIKDRGGIAIVQSPEEALGTSMPNSALRYVEVDYTLRVAEMPAVIDALTREHVPESEWRATRNERFELPFELTGPRRDSLGEAEDTLFSAMSHLEKHEVLLLQMEQDALANGRKVAAARFGGEAKAVRQLVMRTRELALDAAFSPIPVPVE